MAFLLLPNELWTEIEPLLPKEQPKPKGGRPPIPNRSALLGIVFVLRTGSAWRMLPQELGCGSGVSCWRRLSITPLALPLNMSPATLRRRNCWRSNFPDAGGAQNRKLQG